MEDGTIGFPIPSDLPNDDRPTPYVLLEDDAFALCTFLMRALTFVERIFNYRVSRCRRVVENAFGILAQRWQVFLTTMQQAPSIVQDIIECCVCLHNLMRVRYPAQQNAATDQRDEDHNLVPGLRMDGNCQYAGH